MSLTNLVLVMVISTNMLIIKTDPQIGRQYIRRAERVQSKGEVVKTVTVSMPQQCALQCQIESGCVGFNVNRGDQVPAGQLLCQVLADTGDGYTTNNDQFDYYVDASTKESKPDPMSTATLSTETTSVDRDTTREETETPTTPPDTACRNYTSKFNDAVATCKVSNASMKSVSNALKAVLFGLSVDSWTNVDENCTCWGGLYSEPTSDGFVWKTTDESPYYNFTNWDVGQPPDDAQLRARPHYVHLNCTTMKWTATTDHTVCRKFTAQALGDKKEVVLSWTGLNKHCNEIKKTAASLTTDMEGSKFRRQFELAAELDSSCTYWIGLQMEPADDGFEWMWANGDRYNFANEYWDEGQPPDESQLKKKAFYAFANCSTGMWSASDDQSVPRYGFCFAKT